MLRITLSLCFFLFCSCAAQQGANDKFMADIGPVTDPTDLKQLIAVLPYWSDRRPEFRQDWIERNGSFKGDDTFVVTGDGAQPQLRLTKLPAADLYELETGIPEWPEGGRSLYRLKRVENGWEILSEKDLTAL